MPSDRKLRVFLCHSSNDKPAVRELYQQLKAEGWIDPWLDEEKLYPGQDWDLEIEKAVEAADAVVVFLSNNSVTKEGYIQRELRFVLRIADFKPEGTVFVIPVRLDDCPMPRRLSMWQYVDYFPEGRRDWAYKRLLGSLRMRLDSFFAKDWEKPSPTAEPKVQNPETDMGFPSVPPVSPDEETLYEYLIQIMGHDYDRVDQLIEYEQKRFPHSDRKVLLQRVVERFWHENR